MERRSMVLAAVLGIALSAIFFLPPFRLTESAMSMEMPKKLGPWTTHLREPSKEERESLAADTKFSKATCVKVRPGSWDFMTGQSEVDAVADISIVLSGHDLANSIHRPERCMPAQGHDIYQSDRSVLEVPGERPIPVRRLLSRRKQQIENSKDVIVHDALTIYFFVGHQVVTDDHSKRTKIDMKDRLQKGEAQSWAYVTVTMLFKGDTKSPAQVEEGGLPDLDKADKMARELLGDLVARNVDWKQIVN
jgi:hypothetical protein